MLPNGVAARGVETTENHLFRDFSKMAGGTILVSRTQFGYVLRKFQPDFGGPGTSANLDAQTVGAMKNSEKSGFLRIAPVESAQTCSGVGPGQGGPAGTVWRGSGWVC